MKPAWLFLSATVVAFGQSSPESLSPVFVPATRATETRDYVTQVMRFYEGSSEPTSSARGEMRTGGVRRILEPNGTVLYTNIAYSGSGALAPGR